MMRRLVCWLIIFIFVGSSCGTVPVSAFSEQLDTASAQASQALQPENTVSQKPTPVTDPPTIVPDPGSIPTIQSAAVVQAVAATTPNIVIATFSASTTIEYAELYNQSDKPVNLADITLKSYVSSGEGCQQKITTVGWLLPGTFVTVRSALAGVDSPVVLATDCLFDTDLTRIEVYQATSRVQLIDGILPGAATWYRHKSAGSCALQTAVATMKQTGSIADYTSCSGEALLVKSTVYLPPDGSGLAIVEVFPNARNCLPSEMASDCADYIKMKNTSTAPVDLAGLRVRTGSRSANATITTSFNWEQPTLQPTRDEYELTPGAYFILRLRNDGQPLSLSNGDGNVWIEDYYGIKSYDEVAYSDMELAAAKGRSWAFDDSDHTWKLGLPSPSGANTFPSAEPGKGSAGSTSSALKPCRDDQYRSEETNRCRNITADKVLTPCKEGQYRSEETNRCRSIALAAAAELKPCADDQFRNPLTGRCKKIASSDDITLADCGEGRERNPETNRCRNVHSTSVPDAAFAVQPIKDTATAFAGWWALGGVGVIALGCAGWEWREEVRGAIRKVSGIFSSGK
jgi:hypothetical protein